MKTQIIYNLHISRVTEILTNTFPNRILSLKEKDKALLHLNYFVSDLNLFGATIKMLFLDDNTKRYSLTLPQKLITDDHCSVIRDLLKSQKCKLKSINLRKNQITDVGLESLSDGIKTNKTLVYIELSRNLITDTGATHLLRALEFNYTLKKCLFEFGNEITGDLAKLIKRELKAND